MSGLEPPDGSFEIDDATARRYLRMYLQEAPVATALWRSIEAAALSTVELPHPILDIGCGFGEFGRMFFRDSRPPEVGIDIDTGELHRAVAAPLYGSVVLCDARQQPFGEGAFASVMSISTMEHIPLVDATIREVARVLRPGGLFAYTVPVKSFNTNLIGHRVLKVASTSLADRYAGAVHERLTHVNVWPSERWVHLTREAGFEIERAAATVSPLATKAFEALLPAAYANRLWRQATGHRPPHPEPFVQAAQRVLLPLVRNQPANGSNLFVVARKPR